MALVTETLVDLLRRQIDTHGTVVWYDPQHAYLEVSHSLRPEKIAGAEIHRYEPGRGFLWLRRQLESRWAKGEAPPRLLVYVPMDREQTHDALIEFEIAGTVVRPNEPSPEQNTALAAIARRALAAVFPPAAVDDIAGQVQAGKLSLDELDRLAEQGAEAQAGALAVLFGTGNAHEVALRFLSDPSLDAEIEARQLLDSLAVLLGSALGVTFPVAAGQKPDTLHSLRSQLARQVLVTELAEAAGESLPAMLKTFPLAARPVARQAAGQIARAWRNRRDLAKSYVTWATQVQAEIGQSALDLALTILATIETFPGIEARLQQAVEAALAQRPTHALVTLAEARRSGFWSAQQPECKTRWSVIAAAGRVLLQSARVETALKGKNWTSAALVTSYTSGDDPWCDLDTGQRHMEREIHLFDPDPQQHEALIQLVASARQRYAHVADRLAETFVRAYQADHFNVPGVRLQADVYAHSVAPELKNAPVGYILVDALRFEMARELLGVMGLSWTCELVAALATPPTITEIGMAALLPGGDKGLAVAPAGSGRLEVGMGGRTLKTRQERLAYAQSTIGGQVAIARLDQLAPLADMHLAKTLKAAQVIIVTATEEIDGLCENNPTLARRMLDDVLNQLRRGIKTLFGQGVETVIISADHGYLFGETLTAGQAIDAPGGQTAVLKRRAWVGQGGAAAPGYLRAPLSAFGLGGSLELATPWNLSCFKMPGGATEYFHGGLSLPELVIPVLTVRAGAAAVPAAAGQMHWALTLGSRTISTRFVSVTVEGKAAQLLPVEPPLVRLEVKAGTQTISAPVSASYGFQETTGDVRLELETAAPSAIAKNTVTLMISEMPGVDEVTVHLIDATTGIELARLDHVSFAIAL